MNVLTAAARAIMPPRVEKKPLSRAEMKVFNPNHRKNRIVHQSAIADMSIIFLSFVMNCNRDTQAWQKISYLSKIYPTPWTVRI
jgi:hypothetical protein